jgi:hypothetical protein
MSGVIGLFPCKQEVTYQIEKLEDAGYPRDRIRIITESGSIHQLLCCDPNPIVKAYAGWGAFIGIAIYGIFALVASWCECNLLHFGPNIGLGIVIVGVLCGAFIGAFIGGIVGMAEYEKDTHLYTRGISKGSKVLVLETNTEQSERAERALRTIGCTGVRCLDNQR